MLTLANCPGSKNRIVGQLQPLFPGKGKRYFEPFAGKGSVYFGIREFCFFEEYALNDLRTSQFFKQLQNFKEEMIPSELTKEDFENQNILLESYITILGKGFKAGYYDRSREYNKAKFVRVFKKLKLLLSGVIVTGFDWESFKYNEFTKDDFIYFDPPYLGTDPKYYGQIDHSRLLKIILSLKCRWILSGYETPYYNDMLGEPKLIIQRRREMSQFNSNYETSVGECIWYDLTGKS